MWSTYTFDTTFQLIGKAFETNSHSIVLQKLAAHGLGNLLHNDSEGQVDGWT